MSMSASPFFAGVNQEPITFHGFHAKAPLFFRDVGMMAGVFTADLAAARSLMPTARHHPLRVLPRRAVAAIHCMEYRDTGIGPYNEVSLSIAIAHGRNARFGPARLARAALSGVFHAHVVDLPVTTEAALWGGIDVFNYPKWLARISYEDSSEGRICTVGDRDTGEMILRVEGRRLPTRANDQSVARDRLKTMTMFSHPVKDGATLLAKMEVNVIESAATLSGKAMRLEYGTHPRSEVFRRLRLGRPLQVLFAPRCEAMLFRPEVVGE